jgi:hypothetical protein
LELKIIKKIKELEKLCGDNYGLVSSAGRLLLMKLDNEDFVRAEGIGGVNLRESDIIYESSILNEGGDLFV